MTEKFFDHDVIHSGFEQPRGKSMAQVMEVQFVHPCPFDRVEPPMLEGVGILPAPEEPATGSRQIPSQRCTGKVRFPDLKVKTYFIDLTEVIKTS